MTSYESIGASCLVLAYFLVCWYVLRSAYRRGYKKGWSAAEAWIVTLETEVDQERQRLWRESGAA